MSDIEEQLTASFHQQVRQVSAGPDLARRAYTQARRIRFRRRLSAGLACVAALAIALPVGLDVAGGGTPGGKTEILPIDTRSPEPRPSASAKEPRAAAKASIDLDTLPAGKAPASPWYADGVIHDGDQETPIGVVKEDDTVSFLPVAGGYLVETVCCESDGGSARTSRLIGPDGEVRATLPIPVISGFPVVSPDGRLVVWEEEECPGASGEGCSDNNTLVAVDTGTGDEVQRTLVKQFGVNPVGFHRGLVVFSAESTDNGSTGLWNPETGAVRTINGLGRAVASDGSGRFLVEKPARGKSDDFLGSCYTVVDTSDRTRPPRTLWENCDHYLKSFSADRRFVAGPAGNGESPPESLLDLETGRSVLELNASGRIAKPVLEENGDVVVEVTQDERQALVRCSLDGECELASEIRPAPAGGGTVIGLQGEAMF
ncbi:MAG: hypothetical protein ACRDP8_11335 [Actinopolymorphaceae bacterium]